MRSKQLRPAVGADRVHRTYMKLPLNIYEMDRRFGLSERRDQSHEFAVRSYLRRISECLIALRPAA